MTRYLVTDGWPHIFVEEGRQVERSTRFAFDVENRDFAILDVQRDWKWHAATRIEKDDLLDSLINANGEALDDPGEWNLEQTDVLPNWN